MTEEDITKLWRGERPSEMDFKEFKIRRKMLQKYLKLRVKYGRVQLQSEE